MTVTSANYYSNFHFIAHDKTERMMTCYLLISDTEPCSLFTDWGDWSCFCGSKRASRTRTCQVEPCTECGGTSESETCNEYSDAWDPWGQCECATSTQERTRGTCLSTLNDTCDICGTPLVETRSCGAFGVPESLFSCCLSTYHCSLPGNHARSKSIPGQV